MVRLAHYGKTRQKIATIPSSKDDEIRQARKPSSDDAKGGVCCEEDCERKVHAHHEREAVFMLLPSAIHIVRKK